MKFTETPLPGVFVIEPELLLDERGFFARTFCRREFKEHGLNPELVQCSISFNLKRGTLRGLHYQAAPFLEDKVVRCTRGAIFDVALDLRPESPTYKGYFSLELSAENHRMLYIPGGLAHGFQTLEPDTEVFYQMSEFYTPGYSRGVRWDDEAFGISWPPEEERTISERDRSLPDFEP